MSRGVQWTMGGLLAVLAVAAVGWMMAGGRAWESATARPDTTDVMALEQRRIDAPTTIYSWRSPYADVVREVEAGSVLQVNIPSVREGWVAVYEAGALLGHTPIDAFVERVDWSPPASPDTSAAPIEPASLIQINRLTNYLKPAYSISDAFVTTSSRYEWTYFLMARVHGPDVDAEFGLWLTKGVLNQVHEVVTVNDVAASISTADSAQAEGAEVSAASAEARRLRAYLDTL